MNNGDSLTNEQTEKVLQFQDVTGIEDINVSRDVLIRHHWNLEVELRPQSRSKSEPDDSWHFAGSDSRTVKYSGRKTVHVCLDINRF